MPTPSELEKVEFAENPEPRCPVVMLLDTSGSMEGNAIVELNQGLQVFSGTLKEDRLAALRVEIAMITFGGDAQAINLREGGVIPFDAQQAFVTVDNFHPPTLTANGETPMGQAALRGLSLLRDRKEIYKRNHIEKFRPWMFLITDGNPTDRDWKSAADQVKAEENRGGLIFFGIGVENADMVKLAQFSDKRQPLKLKGLAFGKLFEWLSASLSSGSRGDPGGQAPLAPIGWAQIDT